MFFKIGALKSFANFTGKYLCWSLFLTKSQELSQCYCNFISTLLQLLSDFIEITLRHMGVLPVSLLHIFRTPFGKNTYGGLLLPVACNFTKHCTTNTDFFIMML